MTYILLIIIVLLLVIISYLVFEKDILSPSFISTNMYLLCIVFATIGLKTWNTEKTLNNNIFIIVIIGLVFFMIGEALAKYIASKKTANDKIIKENNIPIVVNKYLYILTILFLIAAIVLQIIEIKRICNFYNFYSNSLRELLAFYRTKIGLFSTDLIKDGVGINFFVKQMRKTCDVLFVIWAYILINNIRSKSKRKVLFYSSIPVLISLFSSLLTSGRSLMMHMVIAFIMMSLLFSLGKYDMKKNLKALGVIVASGMCALLLFYLILPLTGRETNHHFVEYTTFYLGSSIPSFSKTIDDLPKTDYIGEKTFSGIYSSLGRYRVINYMKPSTHEWVKFPGFKSNVYTSFRNYYIDFGLFGVVFCQLIFGFLFSLLYSYTKNTKNKFAIIFYSYYGYILIDQIRDEQFFGLISTTTIAYLLLMIILYNIFIDTTKIIHFKEVIKTKFLNLQKNKFYKNLVKNSFWAFTGDFSASLLNLVVTIILIRLIGSSKFGILILAQTYMQIIDVILNVQSWKSVIQFGQDALVKKHKNRLISYIKLGTSIDVFTAILGGVVAIFVAPIVGNILKWSPEAILCARIFSITIFSHLSGTSTALLRIFDKFHLVAIQKFITALIKVISLLVVLIYFKNISLTMVVIIYCITDIIGNLLLVLFAMIEYAKKYDLKEVIKSKYPKDMGKFTKFTLWSTLGDITDIPVNYFDVFIISMLGTNMVAIFKVFKQCVTVLKRVTSAIQQAIMPQFSSLVAEGQKERGFRIVKKIRNAILKIMLPFGFIVGITSIVWLNTFFGPEYAERWYVLLIYLIIQIIALSFASLHPLYISLNKVKEDALIAFISNMIYLIVAYFLVKNIGMMGLVIAFAVQSFTIISIKYNHVKRSLKEV